MGTSNLSFRRISRFVGLSAGTAALLVSLGVGPALAEDQHSGGVSPNEESVDPGAGVPKVLERSVTRGGGLPVTGSDVAGLVGLGALAVAGGSGALAVSKRRTRLSA